MEHAIGGTGSMAKCPVSSKSVCSELLKALRSAHCCAVELTCHLPGFIPVWTADCGIQQQRGIMGHPSKRASEARWW